ncbi:MAG: glycosyltransferase [Leptolyngbyaceae cyanobacterium RU_5_1]|nr:glycosyltransferase [Leptolyngbyaceae cyanobacterium RU_5_1]
MHWTIASPFAHTGDLHEIYWLDSLVPGDRHRFTHIPRSKPLGNWHNQASSVTSRQEWLIYLQQGKAAVDQTEGGVITVFPQLASTVGINQRMARRRIPVVAWLFNVGTCSLGIRRWLAQVSLKDVDCFIVHTRREREMYSKWLRFPIERFEFVPYQVPDIPVTYEENTSDPFLAAIGSAHRDFPTLFQAVEKLNLPTVVASGPRALTGLTLPSQVKAPIGIGKQECLQLAQEARINIIPLTPNEQVTAAGQVTLVEAMRMGRAIIASRCLGVEDYIVHGETGFLVEPQSLDDLVQAIETLWNDSELRTRLGQNARQYATQNFSDEAAGIALGKVLDSVADTFEKTR